jgi:hypothetical protein
MSQCTCATDKEMTCIVHPTTSSLKERIAELEVLADPLTKELYEEMYKRHTETFIENHALLVELERLREAADKYSDGGHHEVCPVNGNYHARCTCGLAELEIALLQEQGG